MTTTSVEDQVHELRREIADLRRQFTRTRLSADDVEAIVETVRVRLLRWLADHPAATYETVATLVDRTPRYIGEFARGEAMSFPLAELIMQAIPEIGDGIICPTCGSLPRTVREG